ncbi:hypothetical protein CRP01_17795 [Flavilitoribacter nigricans DSM 23189 = NBRC 102662]|uniref:Uncharacterized protein n=1 Tax=Flavilitoribacter nigricans (strain ATCC 23147 / DSM 23189 / NBRC 102662 / NCIMB 1420 / SS-2) TaxID=1122177 RepID=A0A2D0NA53_FLAN2|nr:hypothetical protein CRP01_17795 [Flavilitoribacter nigricans DSM 23189 = NBRC 102662]
MIEPLVKWGITHPKKIFQIDGFGAILSALLLGVVLVRLERFFGIPVSTLYLLAALPCLFALYDFYCYFRVNEKIGRFLTGIAIANLAYCALSIGLAIYHRSVITYLGWIYILGEIGIVSILAILELKVAKHH